MAEVTAKVVTALAMAAVTEAPPMEAPAADVVAVVTVAEARGEVTWEVAATAGVASVEVESVAAELVVVAWVAAERADHWHHLHRWRRCCRCRCRWRSRCCRWRCRCCRCRWSSFRCLFLPRWRREWSSKLGPRRRDRLSTQPTFPASPSRPLESALCRSPESVSESRSLIENPAKVPQGPINF